MIIYDLEIIRAIPPKDPADRIPGIKYCAGWHDFAGMGIACAATYLYARDRYEYYAFDAGLGSASEMQKAGFKSEIQRSSLAVGFNNINFDNALLRENGIINMPEPSNWDLLQHLWAAAGLGPEYNKETHTGFSLDAVARANGLPGKTGTGEQAPILWQQGKHQHVINYCKNDVYIIKSLVDLVLDQGWLYDPRPCNPKLHIPAEPLAQLRAAHKAALERRQNI